MSHGKTISARALLLIGLLLAFAICYLYAHSMTVAYGAVELLIAAVCYIGCLARYRKIDGNSLVLNCGAVVLTWCVGIFSGDLKSTLLITVPLLMPLYISSLEISYKDWKDFAPASILAVVITYLAIEKQTFGQFNSNTVGMMGFMGVSLGFLWIKNTKIKIIPAILVAIGLFFSIRSGCRNVAITALLCVALLLIPDGLLKKPTVYFSICMGLLVLSIFASDIIAWAFSKEKLSRFLLDYTTHYSSKKWEMLGRVDFFEVLKKKIAQRDILQQLFGTGTFTHHGHNLFLQCVLNFGYVGTALIYAGFWRVFRLAHILITQNQDDVALGCVIVLWGLLLLQIADVFVIGHETYAVIPQVIMGIILNRYNTYILENEETIGRLADELNA